jgi:archaellum component FlaC
VQNIIDLQKQRENITRDIEALQSRIDIQTEEIKRQIRNIKINIDVPKINYNNLSDSALVARILAN